ncbi:MAG: dipicolinate synthase subunit DpsA [Oscillospiraceae bacterium]|nr:dipicolinate synthase subunit DpsA [Oscillospiraceae bacterium]
MQKTFLVIGGDLRQIYAAGKLSEKFNVYITGFDKNIIIPENIKNIDRITDITQRADYLLLPTPISSDNINLNAPFCKNTIPINSVISCLKEKGIIFGGKINPETKTLFENSGFWVYDYLDREEFSVMNAVPTAEGAVQIALEELPTTIYHSEILITGWGRIAKILAHMLTSLGATVTVCARKCYDLTWAEIQKCKTIPLSDLHKSSHHFDMIFNTIPAMILDKQFLQNLNSDCLIIDLASKPGGVDFSFASSLGIKSVWALGLPGKSAPVSSGHIVAETITNILRERGEPNE